MTTLMDVARVIGAFGTWALVGVYYWIGRDMQRRLNDVEAMQLRHAKLTLNHIEVTTGLVAEENGGAGR